MSKENTSINLKYEIIRNDFSKAGEASSKVKKVLTQLGIDSKVIRRVAIVTYEAELNIVIHSIGGEVIVNVDPIAVEINAVDKGPGINDINLAMKEGYSTAPESVRELGFGAGMGLPNMKKCSDEFNIISSEENGTKVLMKIYI